MGELLERFERLSAEIAEPIFEAAENEFVSIKTPHFTPHHAAAANRKKHPIGHHRHRYGSFVLGSGLLIAAIMLMMNRPFWEILLVLGLLILAEGAIAYTREG